jgi:hypothetical protein
VVRTFAFKASASVEQDFLDDTSVGVIVAPPPDTSDSFAYFVSDPGTDELVDGTTWVYQDAMHVSSDPNDADGAFLWLVTEDTPLPPPTGSWTLTGPDSPLILEQKVFLVRRSTFGLLYQVDPISGTDIFVVVTAIFSK